ncbi:2-dehydropantoate 2-reductase [uncultured Lutibacter sp.]|uniref:ketopantoate reductase family protein n=1 Tax=uncultured Lutibacter sp. TaxID=437739 RepID=UPI002602DEA9|nr:2-dehydropantoate 2-reductase [uncultured Lutibacter sp.]
MNIVIYGTGGVGGYFGARLEQAGNNVTFIARGKHLQTIQQHGLQLKSIKGNYLVHPANAVDSISKVKDIDLILIGVKTWQLQEVAKEIKPHLGKNTMVIPLLNGVENQNILCSVIDKKHVLGGLCKIVSMIEDYGVVNHVSYEPTIVFGELDNKKTKRALKLEELFLMAGFKTTLTEDIQTEIWTKFLFITTVSGMGALTRSTIGEMLENVEIKLLMYKAAEEVLAIAKVLHINLPENSIEKQFKIIESQPYITTASLQRDIMEGKPSELEAQNGTIVKLGEKLGVPTPINSFIYNCLLPQEKRARE